MSEDERFVEMANSVEEACLASLHAISRVAPAFEVFVGDVRRWGEQVLLSFTKAIKKRVPFHKTAERGRWVSPDPFVYTAYAVWWNRKHPSRKVSHRRLTNRQQWEAITLWDAGLLDSTYLPRKYRRNLFLNGR